MPVPLLIPWPWRSPVLGVCVLGVALACAPLLVWVVQDWRWRGMLNVVTAALLFVLMVGLWHDALLLLEPLWR